MPKQTVINHGVDHQSSARGHQQTHGYVGKSFPTKISPEWNHIANLHQTARCSQCVNGGQKLFATREQKECNAKLDYIQQPADHHAEEDGGESREQRLRKNPFYLRTLL